jgi:hypothetical protein
VAFSSASVAMRSIHSKQSANSSAQKTDLNNPGAIGRVPKGCFNHVEYRLRIGTEIIAGMDQILKPLMYELELLRTNRPYTETVADPPSLHSARHGLTRCKRGGGGRAEAPAKPSKPKETAMGLEVTPRQSDNFAEEPFMLRPFLSAPSKENYE